MGGQDFEVTITGTNWEVTKPTKLAADQPGIEELADPLGRLRTERCRRGRQDLAKFGLDKPAAIVKLGDRQGGKSVEVAQDRFASRSDEARGDRAQSEGRRRLSALGADSEEMLAEPVKFRERSLASLSLRTSW